MASDHGEVSGREPDRERERQLFAILADYFEAVEAGKAPDRTEWLARYPEWAEDIARFLDDQDRLLRLTEPLRPIAAASADSADIVARAPTEPTAGLAHDQGSESVSRNGSADYPAGSKVRYVGDYVLIGEIARGGMGVVFLARQRSLNRPVAVKMLLAGALMSDADEQRFRQEAEAAANLDHPNIVPIFEVGRHDGHSYFSMKLIEGRSLAQGLAEFAADQKALARLISIVARAVHHAHQRGVLHRDLKPSNILLSGGPDIPIGQLEPHVTDFGLAKRIEGDPELTQSGAIVGTPSYMAPEQASGKKGGVTVATDVYGLGAVLYTILAGKPPFQGDSVLETIAQVKDRALDPPSRHGCRIDRDLETICLKCLEKEPGRRYVSAEAVAEDLERWSAGIPILARPISRAERSWRWCRRNPVVAALTSTVAALLALALVGLVISNLMIARERAEVARQRDEARRAVDEMYTEVAEQWLAQQAALEPVQRTFLQKALDYYQRFADEQSTDPKFRLKTAAAYRRIGVIQRRLGRTAESESAHRRGLAVLENLTVEFPAAPEYRSELARSLTNLGALLSGLDRRQDTEQAFRRAFALQEKLATEYSSVPAYQSAFASGTFNMARLLEHTSHPQTAKDNYLKAVVLHSKLAAEFPNSSEYQSELARAHTGMGNFLRGIGQSDEAEQAYRRAMAIRQKLAADSPAAPMHREELSLAYTNLGVLLQDMGRAVEAEKAYREAIALREKLAADSPLVTEHRIGLAHAHYVMGNFLQGAGRRADAERAYHRAIELGEKLAIDSPSVLEYRSLLAMNYNNLGHLLLRTARPTEAERAYRRSVALREKLAADSPSRPDFKSDLSRSRGNLITLLAETGRWEDAKDEIQRAVARQETVADAGAQNQLAWILATHADPRLRDEQLALRLAKKAVELQSQAGANWNSLGVAHYRAGNWKSGIEALERSMKLNNGGLPFDWFFLAMAHWRQGDKDKARKWCTQAIDWMQKNKSRDQELRRFRAEAEDLLGITDARMPNGIDAFRKE